MNKSLIIFVLVFSFFFLFAEDDDKLKLAVMEFEDKSGKLSEETLSNATEYIRGAFVSSNKFIIIAKERQKNVMIKQMKKESYKLCNDKSCQIPLGQALSADTILTTTITLFGDQYIITSELVDLAKEATVNGATQKFNGSEQSMIQALDKIVEQISRTISANVSGSDNVETFSETSREEQKPAETAEEPAGNDEKTAESSKNIEENTDQPVETFPETSQNETVDNPVETLPETSQNETVDKSAETLPETSLQKIPQETKKSEIKWKFYSKNKAHVFIDQEISGGDAKDTYGVLQTEDFGEISYKNYTFGIRKTLLFFADKEDDSDYVTNFDYVYSDEHFNHCWEQYLDRLYMKGKWKNFQFTAGDFYESMNRGMAFSMKNDQVYGDNSIRGANIAANYNGFFIKAFGGRANPQLRDSATFRRMNEADDWLAGMETGYKWKIAEAAVQYGYGNYGKYNLVSPSNAEASRKRWLDTEKEFHFIGSYFALRNPFPGFSFYAGAVYVPYGYENTTEKTQLKENDPKIDKEKTDLQNAAAFYSSVLYYFDFGEKKSRLTFKLEGKMYNKFFLNYNRMEDKDYQKRRYFNPPSLLPKELQIDNEFDTWAIGGRISFNENYSGIKFHADLVKGDSLGNKEALPSNRNNLYLDYQAENFWYSALGAEKDWEHVSLSAGVGWHTVDGNSDKKNSRDWIISYIHVGGFVSDFSIKLTNDYYHKDYWLNDIHEMDHVHELKTVAEVSWKYKRTHELFAAVKNTTWIEKGSGNGSYSPDFYTGGSIGYKYKFLRIYVFGGLEKGGYTCDGGMCRYLPDFKGVKTEIEINL